VRDDVQQFANCRAVLMQGDPASKSRASMYSIPIGIRCSCPNCNMASIMFKFWTLKKPTAREGMSEVRGRAWPRSAGLRIATRTPKRRRLFSRPVRHFGTVGGSRT
jgi:hypothetical protein